MLYYAEIITYLRQITPETGFQQFLDKKCREKKQFQGIFAFEVANFESKEMHFKEKCTYFDDS